MTLNEEIIEAQNCFLKPPPNESTTCEWVIYPFLLAIGYRKYDIHSRIADVNKQFPDYTILPDDSAHAWYLEAKAWNESLEDKHAQQALNYANQNGGRFVVLTNGKVWRLYDNAIQGIAADKLVTQVNLDNTARIETFLQRMGKSSVTGGDLERYASKNRLQSFLTTQLRDSDSKIIYAILDVVKQDSLLYRMQPDDIVNWFRHLMANKPAVVEKTFPPNIPPPVQTPVVPAAPTAPVKAALKPPVTRPKDCQSLEQLLQAIQEDGYQAVANTKPQIAWFPDNSVWDGGSWVDYAEATVRWLIEQNRAVPIPFSYGPRKIKFLNHTNVHNTAEPTKYSREIRVGLRTFHLYTNLSAN